MMSIYCTIALSMTLDYRMATLIAHTKDEKIASIKSSVKLLRSNESIAHISAQEVVFYTHLLFTISDNELKNGDIDYCILLSEQLSKRKEAIAYGVSNFRVIVNPEIKLFWATVLYEDDSLNHDVVLYLGRSLCDPVSSKRIEQIYGPGFLEFKNAINERCEKLHNYSTKLIKVHQIERLAAQELNDRYTSSHVLLSPDGNLHSIQRLGRGGVYNSINSKTGAKNSISINQPHDADTQEFRSPLFLSRNTRGDLLCCWTIKGSGDHGIGLLRSGAKAWETKRTNKILANVVIIDDLSGGWLMVINGPIFQILRVENDLRLTELGKFNGLGHHSTSIIDACMISPGVLHCFWSEVMSRPTDTIRMRCVDFDINRRYWFHDRTIWRANAFVISASNPKILKSSDGSLQYFWRIQAGNASKQFEGTYYHSEASAKTVKISGIHAYNVINCGAKSVIFIFDKSTPDKVYVHVVDKENVHPASEVILDNSTGRELKYNDIITSYFASRVWLMIATSCDRVYELSIVDGPPVR